MKRELLKHEEESFEFFNKHQKSIEFARSMVKKILLSLKFRKRIIDGFGDSDMNVSHVKKQVVISASTQLVDEYARVMKTQKMLIHFFVSLENLPTEIESISFDRHTTQLSVSLNYKTFPSVGVVAIETTMKQHVFGFKAEDLFYKKFLLPLKKSFPEQIVYVYPAGGRKDLTQGIDFVVGYKHEEGADVIEVPFQYKTSFRQVQRHKQKYPSVSLFVAHTNMLSDLFTLKGHFFIFLRKHLTQKVVIPNRVS